MDAGGTRDTATPLALDTPHTEDFTLDGDNEDVDYYRIEVVDQSGTTDSFDNG